MSNKAEDQIKNKLRGFKDELERLVSQIREVQKHEEDLKDDIHHQEAKGIFSSIGKAAFSRLELLRGANNIRKDKQQINQDEDEINKIKGQIKIQQQKIQSCEYWLRYANNTDVNKQEEAVRQVARI